VSVIIRSQDKKSIINFDRIDTIRLSMQKEKGVIKSNYQTDIFYDSEDTFGVLGTYLSVEKAIKVLDMIEVAYRKNAFIDGVVFQMPQDSEVWS
jgi:hypothetical protein